MARPQQGHGRSYNPPSHRSRRQDEIDKALKLSEAYGVQWTAINHYEEFCDIRSNSIWRRRRPLSKKEIEKMLEDF